jgi:phosphomannomutase
MSANAPPPTALIVAIAHAIRPIDDRLDAIESEFGPVYQERRSVDCPDDRKSVVIDTLGDHLPATIEGIDVASINDADGFKVQLEDGSWLLVRPSGTEPKLRLYAEATDPDWVLTLLNAGERLVTAVRHG